MILSTQVGSIDARDSKLTRAARAGWTSLVLLVERASRPAHLARGLRTTGKKKSMSVNLCHYCPHNKRTAL